MAGERVCKGDGEDGWNRKGLISEDGQKKKAFFILKDYYDGKNASN